ncbi:T cell activation RhoGTPase activating protein b isoform X1 [Electrophorus electricus]|uniref:Rho-GAP domain-containing protein n=1 Tax=Electrophorus electricus TaxID=8005 RepID=A0A4W4FUG0_ELEEL|nr:T cell activation RhoGTPase activating protein b isoform X1 [Electrophorus electricus]
MKVLTNTITNKSLNGGEMDSVIELPVQDNDKVSAPSTELCKQGPQAEQPIAEHESNAVVWKNLFSFKLKRSSTHSGLPTQNRQSLLFGCRLAGDTALPKPITEIFDLLWRKGPSTEGVFRKPCNNKNLNALREQLDSGAEVDMEALPVVLLVGLLKTFLRELPGSLLVTERYAEWVEAVEKGDKTEKLSEMKRIADKLPRANNLLLQNLLCLLHHVSKQSQINKMDAKNLAVCIAPTLLQRHSEQALDVSTAEKVTNVTQFLIENCCDLFGEKILTLFGDPEDEDPGNNSDSTPSNQHDSAYESPDPDGDAEGGEAMMELPREEEEDGALANSPIRIEYSHVPSGSSEAIFETYNVSFNRRSSEPTIFPSAPMSNLRGLARSHDDCSTSRDKYEDQPLKKLNSDNTLLHPQECERRTASAPVSKTGSCSSSCSLESSASNVSENSPFTSSPLTSPMTSRKSQPTRHASTIVKTRTDVPKMFKRARSLGSFSISRSGSKKGEVQKDAVFPCETLPEDTLSEADAPDEPGRRQRPLSAIEVFRHVDSLSSRPPSYEQAVLSGVLPLPPLYRPMTVDDAREIGRKSRPVSMNENILDLCPVSQFMNPVIPSKDCSVAPELVPFRQRAMSESVTCSRMEKVSRRCSQPVFEEFPYAKESYV